MVFEVVSPWKMISTDGDASLPCNTVPTRNKLVSGVLNKVCLGGFDGEVLSGDESENIDIELFMVGGESGELPSLAIPS